MKTLWTDGSCETNPGPGGFAVIEDGKPVALGREEQTTNIRMEGRALVAAMEYAAGEPCRIYTDSEFWVNATTKWMSGWKARGWKKSSSGKIMNLDLVQKIDGLYGRGNIELVWVRAHVGTRMNELADEWANKAREGATL